MFGLGGIELIFIVLLVVLLFGAPAIITYWIGYQAGQRVASSKTPDLPAEQPAKQATEDEESQDG